MSAPPQIPRPSSAHRFAVIMGLVVGVVCLAAGCIGMAFGIVFNQTIPNDAALWLAAAAVAFGLTAHATR
ncbi:MAG TPA: hypothetical protein VH120_15560 [Gemmataceae bacterium]|nr:hypothetical protein [Gemmataceae bacterium]